MIKTEIVKSFHPAKTETKIPVFVQKIQDVMKSNKGGYLWIKEKK